MTCRDEVLACCRALERETGRTTFSVAEIIERMEAQGTFYMESTIRTHVTSRMCVNAPSNHGTTYGDLERVSRGYYRLVR